MQGADTRPETLAALPAGAAAAPAIHYGETIVSYGALAAEVAQVAGGLAALGLARGDRLALWLPNVPAWLALYLAAARLGVVVLAVNTRFRASELADLLGRSGAKALALWPDFKGIDFPAILGEVPGDALGALAHIIVYGEGKAPPPRIAGRSTVAYRALADHAPLDPAFPPEEPSILFTTSGTTSAPKFVLHTQRSVVAHARAVARGFGYDAADAVLLQALPLCGVFGFSQATATLAAGRPMVLLPAFEPAAAARAVARHRATHLNGTDEMLARLIAAGDAERCALDSLRLCGYAAFANAQGTQLVAEGDRRGIAFVGLYGMSEVQALYARQSEAAPPGRRALAGGHPVSPHARVRVRDPESGGMLAPGEAGELELAGPSRFAEYWGDAAATAKGITPDGFVRTGDLGYLSEDGGFVFLARMGDALRLGGFLVNPAEIESFIVAAPGISGCQVVGVPGAHGAQPVAFVTLQAGAALDESALRARCARAMAKYKVPARIYALDAFPVTTGPNGVKIQRGKLREMAEARLKDAAGGDSRI
jgi:fatty-acyl-CoA synthase